MAFNKLSASCFHDYFTLTSSVHRTDTRQASRGDIFKSTINMTLYGLKSIQFFGVKLWNTIPLYMCSELYKECTLKTKKLLSKFILIELDFSKGRSLLENAKYNNFNPKLFKLTHYM